MNQGFRTHPTQPNTRTPGTHARSGSWDRATGVAQKMRTEGPPPPRPRSLCEFGHRDSDTGVAYNMKSGGPPPHVAVTGRPPRQRRDGKEGGTSFGSRTGKGGRAPIVELAARRRIAARRRRRHRTAVTHPNEPHRRAREHRITWGFESIQTVRKARLLDGVPNFPSRDH